MENIRITKEDLEALKNSLTNNLTSITNKIEVHNTHIAEHALAIEKLNYKKQLLLAKKEALETEYEQELKVIDKLIAKADRETLEVTEKQIQESPKPIIINRMNRR